MKLAGWLILLISLIGVMVSFSITGLIGFFVFLISLILFIGGIIVLVKAKKRRKRAYSYR